MESIASLKIEQELLKHGVCATNTVGKSMKPLFKTHRDAVVLKKPDREIKKYDVVMFTHPSGKYVLHRVVGIKNDFYVIRGDNTFVREFVPKDCVIAYMAAFNRKGKHHSIDEFGYKFYSRAWNFIYPIRFLFHKFFAVLRKMKRIFVK